MKQRYKVFNDIFTRTEAVIDKCRLVKNHKEQQLFYPYNIKESVTVWDHITIYIYRNTPIWRALSNKKCFDKDVLIKYCDSTWKSLKKFRISKVTSLVAQFFDKLYEGKSSCIIPLFLALLTKINIKLKYLQCPSVNLKARW